MVFYFTSNNRDLSSRGTKTLSFHIFREGNSWPFIIHSFLGELNGKELIIGQEKLLLKDHNEKILDSVLVLQELINDVSFHHR